MKEKGMTPPPPPPLASQQHVVSKRQQMRSVSKKAACRARNRLRSIDYDIQAMHELQRQQPVQKQNWTVIANERCGSWYVEPLPRPSSLPSSSSSSSATTTTTGTAAAAPCYFKSTDGHTNTWEFSLKRLNLTLLDTICKQQQQQQGDQKGLVVLVDSSVRKLLPDSFSRTIPIWACVMNRIALRYRHDLGIDIDDKTTGKNWDVNLYTPAGIVPAEEHGQMLSLVEDRVETLYRSRAIVHPRQLVEDRLVKPIRVVWMDYEGQLFPANETRPGHNVAPPSISTLENMDDCLLLVCWNPSLYQSTVQEVMGDNEDCEYVYIPGAADDQESWARKLTPSMFWRHRQELLDPSLDDDQVEALIDRLVQKEKEKQLAEHTNLHGQAEDEVLQYCDRIGELNVWVGSRRSGRPPGCWKYFDAILNVTTQDYAGMTSEVARFYLQLSVAEGKRDKSELERWMPVGLAFLLFHLQKGRRILIHCAQGRDRSVAVALVFVVLFCSLEFPIQQINWEDWDLEVLGESCDNVHTVEGDAVTDEHLSRHYLASGLSTSLVYNLLQETGKERFLKWVHSQQPKPVEDGPMADKEKIRIALHLLHQYRPLAEPTRTTMQKINRFLMSSSLYRISTAS